MKLNNKGYAITVIVFGILIVFIIVLSSLLVTMNNSVKLNKVVKEEVIENIQLGADTTGMSLTERIEQLEYTVSNIKKETINEIYPVGSIYISTTDDNIDDVIARFGGEWEKYSQGRTLVGEGTGTDINGNVSTFAVNNTGGEYSHTLTTSQLPSHSHIYSKSSTTTGSTVLTVDQIPSHRHMLNSPGGTVGFYDGSGENVGSNYAYTLDWNKKSSRTDIYISSGYAGGDQGHTHSISQSTTATTNTGSGSSFNVQNPYITVYMYKRIK